MEHVLKLREQKKGGKIKRKQCKNCYSKGKRKDTIYVCADCEGSPGYRGHTNFTITSTKRGKPMITHFGYDLILHNIDKKRPTRHWRCSRCWMGCKVRAKLLGYSLVYLPGAEHNHPPNCFIPCIDV